MHKVHIFEYAYMVNFHWQILAALDFAIHCSVVTILAMDEDPKPIKDLLESLKNHTDLLQPKDGALPEVCEILEYD